MQRVRPFSLLIKPVSADCNLRCRYCFYLDHLDFYPGKKHRMSDETLEAIIRTYLSVPLHEHIFLWQGGEPTLMGLEFFERVAELQDRYSPPGGRVSNGLQTNATLLTDELARHLKAREYLVGVSIDGPPEIHDEYRLTAHGRATHEQVIAGLETLRKHGVECNVLCVVTQANAPHGKEMYRYLKSLGFDFHQYIPCVEFDPAGALADFAVDGEAWGQFLSDVFEEWRKSDTRRVSVRQFDSIVNKLVLGRPTLCPMDTNCCQYFVVEFSGDVYPCDFFVRSELSLGNVRSHAWVEMLEEPKYVEFGARKPRWHSDCQRCEYLELCAGDCLKHRGPPGSAPETKSVLCDGWKAFYCHSLPKFRSLAKEIERELRTV